MNNSNAAHLPDPREANLTFRALTGNDAVAYRDLRLKALTKDGYWFTANLEQEAAQTLQEWGNACDETTNGVTFAAFIDGQLVGSTGVTSYDPTTAKWRSTYIEPHLRGMGIAETLFEMCISWCIERGFHEVVFTIRADNLRSRTIHEKHGATYFLEENLHFADGSTAPTLWYRKRLTSA